MSTADYELGQPPADPRRRELWLQHLAGFILWEDVRGYALNRIDPALGEEGRAAAIKAINDALYGLMMVADGVTGGLRTADASAFLKLSINYEEPGRTATLDLSQGEGMSMAYHAWLDGFFGTPAVARRAS